MRRLGDSLEVRLAYIIRPPCRLGFESEALHSDVPVALGVGLDAGDVFDLPYDLAEVRDGRRVVNGYEEREVGVPTARPLGFERLWNQPQGLERLELSLRRSELPLERVHCAKVDG